jgi:predicted hotdog family 3-hydroxylacyl-ACP dehydratase
MFPTQSYRHGWTCHPQENYTRFGFLRGKRYLIMFASSLKTGYNHLKEGFEPLKGKVTEQ